VREVFDPLFGAVAAIDINTSIGVCNGFRGVGSHESVYLV
jgi:hypothetical protein